MERNQFTFYKSYYDALQTLAKAERLKLYDTICKYALLSEEPSLTGASSAIFSLIRPVLDTSRRKAESRMGKTKQEQNENNEEQAENTKEQNENTKEQNGKEKEKEKEREKEIEIERERDKGTKAHVPPTREEVRAYAKERGGIIDADKFYDYFQAGEWKDREGKPVRSWKQKMITWEKNEQSIPANAKASARTFLDMYLEAEDDEG